MDGLLIALLIIAAYVALVYVLKSRGILEKHGMTTWGPMIFWKTQRGKDFIGVLARPQRFWRAYSTVCKVICITVMIFIMALLIWEATLVTSIPADKAPSPQMLIGLPGINPIIPVWYGILGLVVAVVVHEFAHGILTLVGKMKLKALGVILFVVPLGAFVEPDEDELSKTDKKKRTSVYSVGPGTNIILALVCAFLFASVFVSAAQPVRDGPVVVAVLDNTPAQHAGIQFGSQIVEINGVNVPNDGYNNLSAPDPGANVPITYYYGKEQIQTNVVSGVVVTATSSGLPADNAGLKSGMIIASINGTTIRNEADFQAALEAVQPGQTVSATALVYNSTSGNYEVTAAVSSLTPIDKQAYFQQHYGQDVPYGPYIGVNSAYLGAGVNTPSAVLNRMAHPYAVLNTPGDFISDTLVFIALPFTGLQPMQGAIADLYAPTGLLAGIPTDVFWIIANSLYWIFWINLMVGMTNALPAVPLDGGFLFRDWIDTLVMKVKKGASDTERARYVAAVSYAFAFLVLFLILWQLIGPRIF